MDAVRGLFARSTTTPNSAPYTTGSCFASSGHNGRDQTIEGFNDWGGWGYDDFVPGEVTKTAPSRDETT